MNGGRAGARGDRFLATVLFTDIVGSTELAAELGDRGWRDLLQAHHAMVRAALKRHGGREVDTAGDGFFAVFDAPADAVACALAIRDDVQHLGLQVRAGLHAGEVEMIAGKVGGLTVPIASRILTFAQANDVLVSSTVRDLSAGSGLHFEDRGVRELKGVPGEWRLFAVVDAAGYGASITEGERVVRRAAAARRLSARPVWQRHPRAALGGAALLGVVVVTAGLWVWAPWLAPALTTVGENSAAMIDAGRDVVIGATAVGLQPAAIAFGEGSVWVANEGEDTITKLDPGTRSVTDTIEVGRAPTGIAIGGGSIWVANSGERSVTRINAVTRRVVDSIAVGNGPRDIAFGAGAVWVANGGDGTVTRLDAATGEPDDPISLGVLPTAIAADDEGAWIVSADAGTVMHLDPATGIAVSAPVAVGTRPSAVVIGDDAVFVANSADGSVSKVDPQGHRVVAVFDVGGTPVGLAVDGGRLWIADQTGAIESLDLGTSTTTAVRTETGAAPQAIAIVTGQPWFVTRATSASHRGGTVHLVSSFDIELDPANSPAAEIATLIGDGLVGYRRVGGIAGTQLVPDLAASIPVPTDGGLTYTFQLRPDLIYSDGTPVRPSDFKFALERLFQVGTRETGIPGAPYFLGLAGDACANPPVVHCDLSASIVPDDAHNTISFHLPAPDPDFLYRLALPMANPLPPSVPATSLTSGPRPVTGPYQIASVSDGEVRFSRNPRFSSWSTEARPDGFPEEIVWTRVETASDGVRMVAAGEADYTIDRIPPDAFSELRTQFTPQLHIALSNTTYLFLNTQLAPFDNIDARRAVAFAVDRAHVVDLRGGPLAAQPTCQVLPPNFPGYQPYCPFTANPGPSGSWSQPDLATARQLIRDSGTAGARVVVGPMPTRLEPLAEYVAEVMRDIGYDATVELASESSPVFEAVFVERRVQVGGFEYSADFPAADSFLGGFACNGGDPSFYCGSELDAAIAGARAVQQSDPAAANREWSAVDRMVTDLGLWVPLVNEGSDVVSARLGNYQFNVASAFLVDQSWVK